MRGGRSRRGRSSTTKSVRTAVWDTKPRKSLLLRPQASTQLSERQGTQTPSLAPRAPPSRLNPERERITFVVFLRERKQGAGQIQERVRAGLRNAKAKGKTLGRPRRIVNSDEMTWMRQQGASFREIAKAVGASAGTVRTRLLCG